MNFDHAKEIFILGMNAQGKAFRPSDWAERLAGVMCHFRPGAASLGSHIQYSPWCFPTAIGGVKCVVVSSKLREAEPMAWDFVINFARDNDLQITEACSIQPTQTK